MSLIIPCPQVLKPPARWPAHRLLAILLVLPLAVPATLAAQPPETPGTTETTAAESPAQDPAPPEESEGFAEEITVTGTRVGGRSATDTAAPVDYISNETIVSTGATETGKILQLLAPSFNFSTTFVSDGTDIIRPATLRALGPDQVLVLVNGKRRHQQALLNVQQTIARGSAGYDINAIPASAIDHIEVLRDGAAAQYGSDAIAGVINIILKDQVGATEVSVDLGQHYAGDGELAAVGFNTGFRLGQEGSLNLTLEYRDRGETNRAAADTLRVDPPRVTQRLGDADAEDITLWLNSEIPLGTGELYWVAGYSNREGNSSGFFRSAGDARTIPAIYPNGFLPTLITEPTDASLNLGYRAPVNQNWHYDVSLNYGNSEFQFREENTANVSYFFEPRDPNNPLGPRFEETATEADTGALEAELLSLNLDFTGTVDWGAGHGPLFVAAGAEWREDAYQIRAGDEVSYEYGRGNDRSIPIFAQDGTIAQPGTQGFPGWSPAEAVDGDRNNFALYVDLESQLSKKFLGGAAVRFEDYSDFGSTVNGKLSGRYELSEKFALRGTVSTGFRAPGVQQIFYSQRSTNLNAAGVLTDTLTARQGSDITRAFGVPALEEETSRNYSIGFVAKPRKNFRLTADLYRIDIDDRIVFSSNIQPEDAASCGTPFDPARCPIRAILDPIGVGQVLFFTNAIDTETNGLDLVALYDLRLGGGSQLSLEGALHFNDTDVTARRSSSDILPPQVLFDQAQVTLVEEGQPGEHYVLSGTYYRAGWSANLRLNWFGEVAGEGFTPGFKQTWSGKWLTDVSFSYPLSESLNLTVGGLNVFDTFPDRWDPQNAFPFPQLGWTYGWETLPFGINGGYYFARLKYNFRHGS
jgi:iron complex outermembrane receptor protein